MFGSPRATALALAAVLAAACAGCDAPEPTGQVAWRSDDGALALSYLSPPWAEDGRGPASLDLRIDAEVFGVGIADAPPTHVFHLGLAAEEGDLSALLGRLGGDPPAADAGGTTGGVPEGWGDGVPAELPPVVDPADPLALALFDEAALLATHGGRIDEPVTTVGDRGDVATYQVVLADPEVFVRGFYVPSRRGTVRAVFASMFDLRTPDVDAMVGTLEVEGRTVP